MSFIKNKTIYKSDTVHVYINQCNNPGKKTKFFAVRRDDKTGLGCLLGTIHWSGSWRQYVFEPEAQTVWSAGCQQNITDFMVDINKKWRQKIQAQKLKK